MALRSIMLEMGANIARLRSDMAKAGNTLRKFQRDTERIFRAVGIITGGVSFAALARSAIMLGDEIYTASQKFGISAKEISALKYAAELSNVEFG